MTITSHEVELMSSDESGVEASGERNVEAHGEQNAEAHGEQNAEASGESKIEASSETSLEASNEPSSDMKNRDTASSPHGDVKADGEAPKELHFHSQLDADIAESSGGMELVGDESATTVTGPISNSVSNTNTAAGNNAGIPAGASSTNPVNAVSATGAAANGLSLPAALCDDTLLEEIQSIPNKMGFKIGDVADMLGIKQYVLRYWETEFDLLKPKKASNNQRMYTRKDVENAFLIRKLLHRDRFSIEGARNALKELKAHVKKEKDYSQVVHRLENIHDRIEDLVLEIRRTRQLFK